MTGQETAELLSILKAAYPAFYKDTTRKDALEIINLWRVMFEDEPAAHVFAAVKSLIATRTSNFPPNIGEVKEVLQKLKQPEQRTEQEAWAIASRAAEQCDLNYPQETFSKLPPDIQRAIGSPAMLRNWALTDVKAFQTVVASNFQRSYKAIQQREWSMAKLPTDIKKMLPTLAEYMQGEYVPLTEGEFNNKRNVATAMLTEYILKTEQDDDGESGG